MHPIHTYKVIEVRGQEPLKITLMHSSVSIDLDRNLDLQPLFTLRESLEWFRCVIGTGTMMNRYFSHEYNEEKLDYLLRSISLLTMITYL